MEVERGDVVLMVVPRDLGRPRPGIVVQASAYIRGFSTIFVCPVTSDIQVDLPARPLIDQRHSECGETSTPSTTMFGPKTVLSPE